MHAASNIQIISSPDSVTVLLDQSAASGRMIQRSLAMLGTPGRELRQSAAGVRMAWESYRRRQEMVRKGWDYMGIGLAGSRAHVRQAVARVRAAQAALEAA